MADQIGIRIGVTIVCHHAGAVSEAGRARAPTRIHIAKGGGDGGAAMGVLRARIQPEGLDTALPHTQQRHMRTAPGGLQTRRDTRLHVSHGVHEVPASHMPHHAKSPPDDTCHLMPHPHRDDTCHLSQHPQKPITGEEEEQPYAIQGHDR